MTEGSPVAATNGGQMSGRAGCLRRLGRPAVWLLSLSILTSGSVLPEKVFDLRVLPVVESRRFDWISWETEALASEIGRRLNLGGQTIDLGRPEPADAVLAYVQRQEEIESLKDKIEHAYAGRGQSRLAAPISEDNVGELEAQLAVLEVAQSRQTEEIERIVSSQVATVLANESLDLWGRVWPPVTFRFTELPTYLILSPRNEITMYRSIFLDPGIGPGEREVIEDKLESELRVSALVDDVGGIGSWPTMVIDSSSLTDVIDTVAHEWTHTYLFFHPLGQHYGENRDVTTMNETVASLVGEEVARKVVETYYARPTTGKAPTSVRRRPVGETDPTLTETYHQAMRRIRRHVDELLAAGKVDEAEAFMEAERRKLVERGFDLRRLNQAYFAFHGSYATSKSSIDPIGPWLRQLREESGSLAAFLHTVSAMTGVEDLTTALGHQPK